MARILGVDYGAVRIGLALSDPTGFLAQSLEVVKRTSDSQAVERILEIARAHGVDELVVGLPLHMNGSVGDKAEGAKAFAEALRLKLNLPVDMFDERLTTVAAQRVLLEADVSRKKRKQVVDAVAATVLLQTYLDFRNRNRNQ